MDRHKAAMMIGIARKAGKIAGGEFAAEKAVKENRACLLILSEDASDNTVKKFTDMASARHVRVIRFLPKAELGRAVGTGERSCLAVTDEGLAGAILKAAAMTERSVL